jgi:iron complex transport system ATP-binding protein
VSVLVEATGLSLPGRLTETSLELRAGELACLIGPNGSGKTSLLHALAGIGAPGGEVRIAGLDPRRLPPAQRQHLFAYLPASRDIHWPLTGADLIALGLSGPNRVAVDQVIADLHLRDFADRRVDRLSTGERSRVLIARALVARPKLLLLDEPAANLDPLWQIRLMDRLRDYARAGHALLVAMHDLELTRHYADRLILMHEGAVVADGEPEELLAGPHIPQVFGVKRSEGRWRPVN